MEREGIGQLRMRTAGTVPSNDRSPSGRFIHDETSHRDDQSESEFGAGGMHSAALAQASKEDLSATNGDAAALGNGNASSAPGTVTRNGVSGLSLLGPDGTYRVTENSPPVVNVPSGTSVEIVPAPAAAAVPETSAGDVGLDSSTLDSDGDGVADAD